MHTHLAGTKKLTQLAVALIAPCLTLYPCTAVAFVQDQAHYENALRDESSSPHFVFITVIDDRSGQSQEGCRRAPFVLGAIHREMNLPYDIPSIEKAVQIAVSNRAHVFHFSKQDALDNVALRYTPEEFERARDLVNTVGTAPAMTIDPKQRKVLGKLQWNDALGPVDSYLSHRTIAARVTTAR